MPKKHAIPDFPPALLPYLENVGDEILRRISMADYGMEADRHFHELQQVLHRQNGYLSAEQAFYPAETVELAAYNQQDAVAYTVCLLILIQSAVMQTYWADLSSYWQEYWKNNREALPPNLMKELDAAFALAREKGELD
ncbi:hypothetical protein [Morococcus cerebrosus]|uniref:hypothetical protein n=1 Tax=Morococcus cerebrosus TaxID=1056807 RepID=UPI000668A84B|nr:hypothetical protein [Morococcus cerebrosus]MDU4437250.1 hypothetical protein [Neisseria sp.]OFM99104.1 hypothetical protein HMPREF2638_05580 [Neisseria sp. HMSC055F11]OFN31076.1 hypothetical protein HMPREF2568_08795 [Neisseria sp. HMSC059F02]